MAGAPIADRASERLLTLHRCLESQADFGATIAALRDGKEATFDGVWGSSCALLAATLAVHAPGPLTIVCADGNALDDLCDDLSLFTRHQAAKFPAWEAEAEERVVYDEIYGQRLRLLKQLAHGPAPKLLATNIQSLLQGVPRHDTIAEGTRRLAVGERIDVEGLLKWLATHRFHHTSAVELPGEFSSRGGIIDVFAPHWEGPVRIELFDDEIESIRRFDITSQRSSESLTEVDLAVLPSSAEEDGHLTDYLPSDSWLLLVEPQRIAEEAKHFLRRVEHVEQVHSLEEVMQQAQKFSLASAASLAESKADASCRLQIESVERFSGDIDMVRTELDRMGDKQDVYLIAQTEAEVQRLQEILSNTRLAQGGRLHYTVGALYQGFRLAAEGTVLISGSELFGRGELRRIPRRRLGKSIDSFLDLRNGDLVVHLSHGIGRYRGLKLLDKDEHIEEHLEIEFRGGTKIYVPSAKIELVQKYIGSSKSRPTLATIGGKTWQRQKKAAESAVIDMAADMIDLQAARAARPGIAFSDDSIWQQEFDASFPYQETDDQHEAIGRIKNDMQEPRPMDRLLCGDVGFGKTEVAMRSAFKAVENGYQVAVLVPTTILAEQHYNTFRQRMAEFPFDIAKLSRFCSPREEREALAGLSSGRIDIVIGTHRLASKDIEFFNLGLVVIDEEQRFGVEVKERLKQLRSTVDVLTMTATPIPRTLHMSLVGVRDISNLETPPEDRMSVETRVSRFNDELIRHAVMRELNRGGQIFFVHNRVNDIDMVARKLRDIVPEASIRIGHGQMPESELEQVMVDFVAGRFDLLLATTIVESGLDIPNANTIFIDEADRYGLADLHQLRGRVGRYKHRAYCYLLIEPHKHITPNAAKRLRAIEEFSEMGAGFAIAMRDLEIRGAGNILGTQQSGHIAAVGYELYCQLLENAVRQLKSMPARMTVDVDIDLPGEAYLPDEFVSDMRLKIDLYRRMARISAPQELQALAEELRDRFGPLPEPVRRLLSLAELKMEAALWQIAAIYLEGDFMVLRYLERGRVEQLAKVGGGRLRIVDETHAYLPLDQGVSSPDDLLATAKMVLRP